MEAEKLFRCATQHNFIPLEVKSESTSGGDGSYTENKNYVLACTLCGWMAIIPSIKGKALVVQEGAESEGK